jgi:hypothetical protein
VQRDRPILTITGLSRGDAYDLLDEAPPDAAETAEEPLPAGELGEPVTLAVMLFATVPALAALSAWLAARGKNVEFSAKVQAPGIAGEFTFKARSGDTAEDLAARLRTRGVDVRDD